jgi:hypothetical protein
MKEQRENKLHVIIEFVARNINKLVMMFRRHFVQGKLGPTKPGKCDLRASLACKHTCDFRLGTKVPAQNIENIGCEACNTLQGPVKV